jgi:hypothetical protein
VLKIYVPYLHGHLFIFMQQSSYGKQKNCNTRRFKSSSHSQNKKELLKQFQIIYWHFISVVFSSTHRHTSTTRVLSIVNSLFCIDCRQHLYSFFLFHPGMKHRWQIRYDHLFVWLHYFWQHVERVRRMYGLLCKKVIEWDLRDMLCVGIICPYAILKKRCSFQ